MTTNGEVTTQDMHCPYEDTPDVYNVIDDQSDIINLICEGIFNVKTVNEQIKKRLRSKNCNEPILKRLSSSEDDGRCQPTIKLDGFWAEVIVCWLFGLQKIKSGTYPDFDARSARKRGEEYLYYQIKGKGQGERAYRNIDKSERNVDPECLKCNASTRAICLQIKYLKNKLCMEIYYVDTYAALLNNLKQEGRAVCANDMKGYCIYSYNAFLGAFQVKLQNDGYTDDEIENIKKRIQFLLEQLEKSQIANQDV